MDTTADICLVPQHITTIVDITVRNALVICTLETMP